MRYRAFADENGEYQNKAGERFNVLECHEAIGPEGKNIGFTVYASLNLALAGFGLEKYKGEQ